MAASIRKAALNDQAIIAQYNLDMAKETEGLILDPPTVSAGVRQVLSDTSKGTYYVLEVCSAKLWSTSYCYDLVTDVHFQTGWWQSGGPTDDHI